MNQETINILIFISPVLVGGIIAAINAESVNTATEKVELWVRRTNEKLSGKRNWLARFILNPVFWAIVQFSDWTDSFSHRGLKNGVRLAASLYLVGLWGFLLYVAFMFALIAAIGIGIVYILFKFLLSSNDELREGYERGRKILGASRPGTRIDPDTGVIQEEGYLGYTDTDTRIDPETGNIQKQGIFGWTDTDTKVDQETGNIQKKGLLGYNDTETRIDPDTGVIQKKGLLGWVDTEERINPETGKHQKKGMLGWVDD